MQSIVIGFLSFFTSNIQHFQEWWNISHQAVSFNQTFGDVFVLITADNNKNQFTPPITNDTYFHACKTLNGDDQPSMQSCFTLSVSDDAAFLHIDSDPHSLIPIWFAATEKQNNHADYPENFIISTDYIAARVSSFSNLTAVDGGSTFVINLHTWEISRTKALFSTTNISPDSLSMDLNEAILQALSIDVIQETESKFIFDFDSSSPSSRLLTCSLVTIQQPLLLTKAVILPRFQGKTSMYNVNNFSDGSIFADVHDRQSLSELLLPPSFTDYMINYANLSGLSEKRIREEYRLCASGKVIISFESCHEADPWRIYLRELFSSLLGSRVVYPYAALSAEHAFCRIECDHFETLVDQMILSGNCNTDSLVNNRSVVSGLQSESREEAGQSWQQLVLQTAIEHSTESNITVLFLATYGYFDMLHNFLCYAHALFPANESLPFIVLTNDDHIANLARSFNAGTVPISSHTLSHILDVSSISAADFGTVHYQLLMLSRTKMALDLLKLGFSPLIADIDTVWLRNPLSLQKLQFNHLQSPPRHDVFVVNDGDEVCGCFVLLRATSNTIHFWSLLYSQHVQLVQSGIENEFKMEKFTESEQKILTRMIYGRQYNQTDLLVYLLPASYFPDGGQFFTERSVSVDEAYVIHNNFIIGKGIKEARFGRYGLWRYFPPFNNVNRSSLGPAYCQSTTAMQSRYHTHVFPSVKYVHDVKTVNVAKPVHNLVLPKTGDLSVCVILEGLHSDSHYAFQVMVSSNPRQMGPSMQSFGLFETAIPKEESKTWSFAYTLPGTNLESYIDVSVNREHFAIDYMENATMVKKAHDEIIRKYMHESFWNNEKDSIPINNIDGNIDESTTQCITLHYHIKVLTMKRAASLHRLLTSLANADYSRNNQGSNIALEIFVDGIRRPEESLPQMETVKVAEEFVWVYGPKRVIVREQNIGLASQWHNAWGPQSPDELAFIFEDDLEVSPHYFAWASQAAERYYGCNEKQREMQRAVLAKLHRLVDEEGKTTTDDETRQTLNEFILSYAGFPLMYGICLQRQYLSPNHSPFRMQLRNGNRPYLYSLVGSWGPMFFPYMWEAFRTWWRANDGLLPATSSLITNDFLAHNPGIWTPYIIRFAYEFGAKCLYANLPGNLTLVNNHREAGENYGQYMGPYARLLDGEILQYALQEDNIHEQLSEEKVKSFERRHELDYYALRSAMAVESWPSMAELSRWQIDFNLRRHGSFGSYSPFPQLVDERIQEAQAEFEKVVRSSSSLDWTKAPQLSVQHWTEIINLIEAVLLPHEKVLSVERNPLMLMLPSSMQSTFFLSTHHHEHCNYRVTMPMLSSFNCLSANNPLLLEVSIGMLVIYPTTISVSQPLTLTANFSTPVRFVLMIDVCNSAPTFISLRYRFLSHNSLSEIKEVQYVMVEDVCDSHPADHGAVLYRLKDEMYHIHGQDNSSGDLPFVAVSKRLSETMTTRRMVDSTSNLFH